MTAPLITVLVIQPDKLDYALDYMRDMRDDVHKNEPYTGFYEFFQLRERPNEIWVVENFENEEGKQAHLQRHSYRTPHFDEFLAVPAVLNDVDPI